MILSTRTKAAGGQSWHRAKVRSGGIRTVGIDRPSWLHSEHKPEENLADKAKMKQAVRQQAAAIDEGTITVVPEGKRAKRGKRK